MTNTRRGEISICLGERSYPLCLTLAAMAEMEDSLGLDNIGALASRFSNGEVRSSDLIKILGAALRGGGADISDDEAAMLPCEGGTAVLIARLIDLLRLTFIGEGQYRDHNTTKKAETVREDEDKANPA